MRWNIPTAPPSDVFSADWFRVDMYETDEDVQLVAELPGVDRNDVEISLDGDKLTVRGEKKSQQERKAQNYHRA